MKNKKDLMLRLTIVSFALNIASIFLSVLNHITEKTDLEKTTSQKYKDLIDKGNFINAQNSLDRGGGSFHKNILT